MTAEEACSVFTSALATLEADGFVIDYSTDWDGELKSVDICKPGEPAWASIDWDTRAVEMKRPIPPVTARRMFDLPDVDPDPRLGPFG